MNPHDVQSLQRAVLRCRRVSASTNKDPGQITDASRAETSEGRSKDPDVPKGTPFVEERVWTFLRAASDYQSL